MKVDFLSQAGKLLKEQKKYRRRAVVFLCLAVIVTFGTVSALKLYGQAMTHKVEVLDCQYEVHAHTEDCYEKDENGSAVGECVCGYADYVVHMHNDRCFGADGKLACTLEEKEAHKHTEECYVKEAVLVCGHDDAGGSGKAGETDADTESINGAAALENTEDAGQTVTEVSETVMSSEGDIQSGEIICGADAHTHSEACYGKMLVCGYGEEHAHDGNCITQELICQLGEHTHTEACYDAEGNATCGMEEHTHITECCQETYVCGKEAHIHEDGCYAEALICATDEHEHTETCYSQADMGTAEGAADGADAGESGSAEGAAEAGTPEASGEIGDSGESVPEPAESTAHVHTDACYQEVTRLVCGEAELHTHDDSCYAAECFSEDGSLMAGSIASCGLSQPEEHVHQGDCFKEVELTPEEVAALNNGAELHIHEESCYDGEGNLICGHDATHIHSLECYDEAGNLVCDYGTASHVHEDQCYDAAGDLICGYEEEAHFHGDSCYDAEGNLQCGYEAEHVHEDQCYDAEGNLACGYEEAETGEYVCGKEEHVHYPICRDEEGILICGKEEHIHNGVCRVENPVFYCGEEEHIHSAACRNEEGILICEKEEHTHKEGCLEEPVYNCGKEVHLHEDTCWGEDGNLVCGKEKHTHGKECLITEEEYGEIEKVNRLIAALPSEEEIMQKLEEDGEEASGEYMEALLAQIQEAYDAYLGLPEKLREYVADAEYLLALQEFIGINVLDKPAGVPEWAAFLPIGDQGGGMVLELLYGDKMTHGQKGETGAIDYVHHERQGYFRLYTTGIQGIVNIGEITMSVYFPKEYIDPGRIRFPGIPEDFLKYEISDVTEEQREGEAYYKISITLKDYIPTGALELPFAMGFTGPKVPEDYRLKIFGTLEVAGEEKEPVETAENIYGPKYDRPTITKYVNTNKIDNMKEDHTRVAAVLGEDGTLQESQYVSFWYKMWDPKEIWPFREYEKITLTDQLPQYEDTNGNMRYAVFDPEANPGWTLNDDGMSVSRDFYTTQGDGDLASQIEAAELKLRFPGCKIDEKKDDGFLTKDLKNYVEAVCYQADSSEGEIPHTCEDDIIFTLTNQPGADGAFTKGNSADTVMDTPSMRAGSYRWALAFENKGTEPLINLAMEDSEIDERLKFQHIIFNTTPRYEGGKSLLDYLDYVEVVTYEGEIDRYVLRKGEHGEYFKDSGYRYDAFSCWTWTLTLDASKEYKSFKIHFKEEFQLQPSEGITIWPFSTFRNPEEAQFVEEEDLKNVYVNKANVAYQVSGNEETVFFLFSENKFKLIQTFENIWIEKNMIGSSMEYPSMKTDTDGNQVMDYSKSEGWCHIHVKGALRGDRKYEDLRVIDLLPESLVIPDGKISYGVGGQYVKSAEVYENYHNSGRTAVIFYLNVDEVKAVLDASDGKNSAISFTFKVRAADKASVGQYINDAYLVSNDFDPVSTEHTWREDSYDLNGDGNTEDAIRWDQAAGNITAPAGVYAEKYIARAGTNDWKKTVLRFGLGDAFQYKLRVKNITNTPRRNLVVYDVLPQIGDPSINNKAQRGSEFAVKLREAITPPDGYQVYYTDSQEVYAQDMASLLNRADIWKTGDEISNWESVTAFKFVANEGVTLPEGHIDFTIPVKVQENLSEESYGILENKESGDRDTGTAAYLEAVNSFGYSTEMNGVNVESNYVKAQISLPGFVVKKVNDRGDILEGAEFLLEKLQEEPVQTGSETDGESGIQGEAAGSESAGGPVQTPTWTEVAKVTTNADGIISFRHLTEGTYRLTETKAPEGHKRLEDPITITITLDETTMEYKVVAEGLEGSGTNKNPFVVVNEAFYVLPETGGIGSKLYTMAGCIVLFLGAGLLYKKKFRERRV